MPNNHRKFVKVRKEGGSRVLALTSFIPKDFSIVKVSAEPVVEQEGKRWVELIIEKVA